MTRIRYAMPARFQGEPHMQRGLAELVEKDVHGWLVQWLDGFYCGLRVVCMPRFTGPTQVRTHVEFGHARDVNPRDAVKAIVEATGLGPHLSVCGWPFCSDDVNDVDDVDDAEGV